MFQKAERSYSSTSYNDSDKEVNKNRIYITDGNRLPPAPTSNTPTQLFVDEEKKDESIQKKEDKSIQAKEAPSKGSSTKLPNDVKSKMESSFGADLSSVNIHTNDESASNMGALAYTQGEDIHFAPGQYNPSSAKGQELIGHELTHTIQQRQGRVKPDTQQNKGNNINTDKSLEKEADDMGALAAQGKMANVSGIGSGIQKSSGLDNIPEEKKKEVLVSGNKIRDLTPTDENPNPKPIPINNFFDSSKNYKIKESIENNITFYGVNSDMEKGLKAYAQGISSILNKGKSITRQLNFSTNKPKDISGYSESSQEKFNNNIAYRFTGYEDNTGTTKIIVEELGIIPDNTPTDEEAIKLKEKFEKYFKFEPNTKKVTQGDGTEQNKTFTFSDAEKLEVYKAVSLLPEDVLEKIKDAKFLREDRPSGTSKTKGRYNAIAHTVKLYDLCFKDTNTIFGDLESGFHSKAEKVVLHELGHAVDHTKGRIAHKKLNATKKEYLKANSTYSEAYEAHKTSGAYTQLELLSMYSTISKKLNEYTISQNEYIAVLLPSGRKRPSLSQEYAKTNDTPSTLFTNATENNTPITKYGGVNTGELFAESFAMHYADNERFSTLRPELKEYFDEKKYFAEDEQLQNNNDNN